MNSNKIKTAITPTRADNYPEWYQQIIKAADLAEVSPVRGCMIIKPWGYGIWENIQHIFNHQFKNIGTKNVYFPLMIPLSFMQKEAEHIEGFAKECAVITHHRLATDENGKLVPSGELEEPYIIRPTSETIIGDAFSRWIQSYRDLPILINQWANVVRWEMRTRLFLRTAEFLWQEGHTAHADEKSAMEETLRMLDVYRDFAQSTLAIPVIAGEKPPNERFPGAEHTYSIEAMMQDGKALQAGTSHFLGQNFARAQNIRFQSAAGELEYCHTTSWGVTTRLIGGVIMTHGDDDGLRLPPAIAPRQIVIVPILRDKPEDAEVLAYGEALAKALNAQTTLGERVRALLDVRGARSADKRWEWVRRGAPIIVEVGPRDAAGGQVTYMRRDKLRDGEKIASHAVPRDTFIAAAPGILAEIQASLYADAKAMLDGNIRSDIRSFDQLAEHFGAAVDEDEGSAFKGWVRAPWSRPTGAALEAIDTRLKALKLTLRNIPLDQTPVSGPCLFTGEPAVEEVLIARAY